MRHINELNKMSSEQLREILIKETLFTDEMNFDYRQTQEISEILDLRDPLPFDLDINMSFNEFKLKYMNSESKPKRNRIKIGVLVAAIIITLSLFATSAFGKELVARIYIWGEGDIFFPADMTDQFEVIRLTEPPQAENIVDYDPNSARSHNTVEAAEEDLGVSLSDLKLPAEKYKLQIVNISDIPSYLTISAIYISGEVELFTSVHVNTPETDFSFPEALEELNDYSIEIGGTKYYFSEYGGRSTLSWMSGEDSYNISGTVDFDVLLDAIQANNKG